MRSAIPVVPGLIGGLLLPAACTNERGPEASTAGRYTVEVLEHGIDPQLIPDRFAADLDGDGEIDRVTVTDSTVQVELTRGGEFSYSVREPGEQLRRIWDARVFSLRPDGKFPSILLATSPEPSHDGYPVTQDLVYNDGGRLVHKRHGVYTSVWPYPMRALGLDCTWLESNDLPVCFFASMEDGGGLGVSRLIEFDPSGYRKLASDSVVRSHHSWRMERRWARSRRFAMNSTDVTAVSGLWRRLSEDSAMLAGVLTDSMLGPTASVSDTLLAAHDWFLQSSPRQQALSSLRMDRTAFDSIVESTNVQERAAAVDFFLAVKLSELDHEAVLSHDVTREYRLPWPAQYGHAGPHVDGMFMMGAVFVDFSGDGLSDLVVVGQHSRPFSAIQHPDGYFTEAAFHAVPDEYVRVWAPQAGANTEITVPPCVYFGMEKTEEEAWRSDYLDCYDQASGEWYDVTLPGGPYWTEYDPVMFWDINEDGMMDFAARSEDGSWSALTFVEESR